MTIRELAIREGTHPTKRSQRFSQTLFLGLLAVQSLWNCTIRQRAILL
jgi:hypothetical protein